MGVIEAGWKLSAFAFSSLPAPAARNYGAIWFDSTNSAIQLSTDAGMKQVSAGPVLFDMFNATAPVTAITYGGTIPLDKVTITNLDFRVSAAGIGGTTSNVFRVSDGTLNCDFGLPCNSAVGVFRLDAGSPSTGCAFAAGSTLTYSVNSIGDCATGITVQDVKLRALRR